MKSMPDKSVDAVITDPPYFLPATHYSTRSRSARSLSDLSMLEHFYHDIFVELARVTKPTGSWYVFCDGQSYPAFYVSAYPHVKALRPLIWDKVVSFNGYTWRHQHEIIMFAELPEAKPIPTGDGDILRNRAVPINDREHLAEKPTDLLAQLVRKCGQIIFDPFVGGGSTGEAVLDEGKKFIGCEIDPTYFAIAEKRVHEATLQPQLFHEKQPQSKQEELLCGGGV
jgi:DNA modification methylase